MFSTPARRQALLASLCLTVFIQQPVFPVDYPANTTQAGSTTSGANNMVFDPAAPAASRYVLWHIESPPAEQHSLVGASIGLSSSADGRNFHALPVTVHLVGSVNNEQALLKRLQQLASAYSDEM